MPDRIRIDVSDIEDAPTPPPPPTGTPAARVFGRIDPMQVSPGGIEARHSSSWLNPKILYPLAGLGAALVSCLLTDGVGGYWKAEAGIGTPSEFLSWFFFVSFAVLLTTFIAAIDDLSSGALGRAAAFGALGFMGGLVGGTFADWLGNIVYRLLVGVVNSDGASLLNIIARAPAWMLVALLCGAVVGGLGRSLKRALLGTLGGAIGGLIGGMLFDPVSLLMGGLGAKTGLMSRLVGLAITGTATGLAIALAESVAKSAWLVIEQGRLIGKQFILYRNPTSIGSSYNNDVYLFKDPAVKASHARIVRRGGGWSVEALPDALVRVDGLPVTSRMISEGSLIQIGETSLRFRTRS